MYDVAVRTSLLFGWCLVFATLALVNACSVGYSPGFPADRAARPARDVPDHFLVGLPNSTETMEPTGESGCRNPMVDPRDGARVRLVRSAAGQGDYEVPGERYGVSEDELLRLECATGRVIGVVNR